MRCLACGFSSVAGRIMQVPRKLLTVLVLPRSWRLRPKTEETSLPEISAAGLSMCEEPLAAIQILLDKKKWTEKHLSYFKVSQRIFQMRHLYHNSSFYNSKHFYTFHASFQWFLWAFSNRSNATLSYLTWDDSDHIVVFCLAQIMNR